MRTSAPTATGSYIIHCIHSTLFYFDQFDFDSWFEPVRRGSVQGLDDPSKPNFSEVRGSEKRSKNPTKLDFGGN